MVKEVTMEVVRHLVITKDALVPSFEVHVPGENLELFVVQGSHVYLNEGDLEQLIDYIAFGTATVAPRPLPEGVVPFNLAPHRPACRNIKDLRDVTTLYKELFKDLTCGTGIGFTMRYASDGPYYDYLVRHAIVVPRSVFTAIKWRVAPDPAIVGNRRCRAKVSNDRRKAAVLLGDGAVVIEAKDTLSMRAIGAIAAEAVQLA